MSMLIIGKISLFICLIEILSKIIKRLYRISSVVYHIDYIFQELILWSQIFLIREMKSALLLIYVINDVFLK